MTRPGAETIEIEPVHLFNLKDYRPLVTARLQALFGDSVPGGGHLLFGARCGGEPAGAAWGIFCSRSSKPWPVCKEPDALR